VTIYSPTQAMVTLPYRMLQLTLRYDTVIQRSCMGDGCRQQSNFAFKNAAKPLQIETWLLLTAYRNSSSLYPTIPSLILYDVRFSHNTCFTDDRQTDDTSYQRLHRTVGQKQPIWKLLYLRNGSTRVPTGFLQQNSLTFPVMEWQFPWHYRNNNPIAQMS